MKKLFLLLLILFSNTLFSITLKDDEKADLLEYSWTRYNNFYYGNVLYCNISLNWGLMFQNNYFISTFRDGQSCEVKLIPYWPYAYVTADGHELKEIIVTVTVRNGPTPNQVDYEILRKYIYNGKDENGNIVTTSRTMRKEGYVDCSAIDLRIEPELTLSDSEKIGYICFNIAS